MYEVVYIGIQSAISPRPASWILERSLDGKDFYPWQYFSTSNKECRNRYDLPGYNGMYNFASDTEVICSTQFSKIMPLENGEVINLFIIEFYIVLFCICNEIFILVLYRCIYPY